jgi:hypothetical protein
LIIASHISLRFTLIQVHKLSRVLKDRIKKNTILIEVTMCGLG